MPKSYLKLRTLLGEIKEIQAKPAPNMNDVNLDMNAAYNYFVPQLRADYKDEKLADFIKNALMELPEEKKKEFIAKAKGPNADKSCTEQEWLKRLDPKDKMVNRLLDNKHWGRTGGDQIVDALEAVLPPEKMQELNNLAENIKTPDEPGYIGPLEEEPYKKQIEALKQKALLEQPEAIESTAKMLDQVNGYLSRVSEEFREYLHGYDSDRKNGSNKLNKMNDWTAAPLVLRGQQTLAGGKFNGTFKNSASEDEKARNTGKTFMVTDENCLAKPLTAADVTSLKNTPVPLSQTAVDAAEKIYGTMGTLDYSNHNVVVPAGDIQTHKGQKPEDPFFLGEQGIKYYAFWPLIDKKNALGKAVEEGNLEKIEIAAEEYKKTEDKFTSMMDTLKDPKLGGNKMFDGNVNSTRGSSPNMPMKFVQDNTSHNQLNSMFCLHGMAKNFNVNVMDMVKDPVNTTLKACQNYVDTRGIDAKSTIGGKLCWGLQEVVADDQQATHHTGFADDWESYFEGPRTRGLAGVVNLEPDPRKRAEYMALHSLGAYAAHTEIKKEKERFNVMSEIAAGDAPNAGEKRAAMYRNAAILAPDQFSMVKMADVFMDAKNPERWRTELDVSEMTKGDNLYKLDYADLATRTQEVLRQHDAEKIESSAYRSAFDKDEYVLNAFHVYTQILANAKGKADLQASEKFKAFEQSVKNMPNLVTNPDVKALMACTLKTMEDPNYFNPLTTDKSDRVFGKKDSDEYINMKDSLRLVDRYLKIVKNGPKDNKEALATGKGGNFAQKLAEAAEDSFEYARLKTNNGEKTSFSAASGARRVEESLVAIRRIHKIQDELGLRSPAQKLYDDARMELLAKRHDKAWMREHGLETVAKVIHAKRAIDAKIPAEDQAVAFAPENWQKEYGKLKNRKEFRDFVANAGPDAADMVDSIFDNDKHFQKVTGDMSKTLTAAYRKQIVEPREARKLDNAKEEFMQGWAMEVAAKKLGLTARRMFDENPALQAKAREVRNDPKFKEVVGEMMKGKTNEQLHKLKTAHIKTFSNVETYEVAEKRIDYEKKCAEIIVNNTMGERLDKMNPEDRRKEMDVQIARCREMPAFRNVMNERFEDVLNPNVVDRMNQQMDNPQKQNELWDDFVAEHQKVLEAEAAKPAPLPRQPQAEVNNPEAQQPQAIGKSGSEMTREERQEFMKNATFGENQPQKNPGGPEV